MEDVILTDVALGEAQEQVSYLEKSLSEAKDRIAELEEQLAAAQQATEDARKYWQNMWKATSQELDEMNEVLKSIAVFARKASR